MQPAAACKPVMLRKLRNSIDLFASCLNRSFHFPHGVANSVPTLQPRIGATPAAIDIELRFPGKIDRVFETANHAFLAELIQFVFGIQVIGFLQQSIRPAEIGEPVLPPIFFSPQGRLSVMLFPSLNSLASKRPVCPA